MASNRSVGAVESMLPVDAHVHFHTRAQAGPALDAAARHFRRVRRPGDDVRGFLLLAEAAHERVFRELAAAGAVDRWRISTIPAERQTLLATAPDAVIAVVCGRQIRAEHGLEVLALGTDADLRDGAGLAATLAIIEQLRAVAVLPWGFGKWIGERGRMIRRALAMARAQRVWLGDNGGRLALLPPPELIRHAAASGLQVLPGSDPFPFGGDVRRVGGFGLLADLEFDAGAPWTALKDWLDGCTQSPPAYGRSCGVLRFMHNQVRIQWRSRIAVRSGP